MTSHLISILGLPLKDTTTGDRAYRRTTYRFPDGQEIETTSFGMALSRWFAVRSMQPQIFDRILWLGTAQSAWGSLLQSKLGDEAIGQPVFIELYETREASQDQLNRLGEALTEASGQRHECRLISPCGNSSEQADFVSVLCKELNPGDRVVLDLTHGLRNQSLLLAQSALMLEGAFGVRIDGMFYGALELKPDMASPAPAVELTGVLQQARLAQALSAFWVSGDLRVLAREVPGAARPELQGCLEALGHSLATNDFPRVQSQAREALGLLALPWAHELLGALWIPVQKAVQQASASYLADSQIRVAEGHLGRKDYLRAAIVATEAVISDHCERTGRDKTNYQERMLAQRELPNDNTWNDLEYIRNHIAHGFGGFAGIPEIVRNPQALEASLTQGLVWCRNRIQE